ncbi:MAG: MFS transporter [Desulfuromonadales bacterium]|nr:MFS transporter [Desulfuromonadales bacterium]
MHHVSIALPDYSRSRFLMARWSIFAMLILAYMLVFFHRMAPAVVSADLMRDFNTSGAALGSLAAMYFYIYTAMQIPSGVLADTLGARVTVATGNLIAGVGSICFGLADSFWLVSCGRALVGLGVSVVFVGLFKSNSVWFSERNYGMVSGLTLLLGNIGAMASAGPLAALLGFYSWRSIFVALGAISLLLAGLTFLLVRNTPEELGFPSVREMEGKKRADQRKRHWMVDIKEVLATRHAWPSFWVDMGMVGGMLAFVGLWAIPYLRDTQGLDRSDASIYTTVALGGFAVGSMLAGWFSDRIGRRKPVILVGTVIYFLACLGLAYLPWSPGIGGMSLFALIGFGAGGFIVTFACAKEVVAPPLAGMAVGLVNTGLFLGAAIIQPLFGWMMDLGWDGTVVGGVRVYQSADYNLGFLAMLVFALLAIVAATRIRETRCKNMTMTERGE